MHVSVNFNWTNQNRPSFGYILGNLKYHASCIFCPKMSFYGKRKSRDYLSDDEPTDNNKKMPNINEFRSEIVESSAEADKNDQLYLAKKIVEGKEVEEGSIPCFVPKGRSGILSQILEEMGHLKIISENARAEAAQAKAEAEQAKEEAAQSKAEAAQAKAEVVKAKTANQDFLTSSLKNDIVQLVYGLFDQQLYSLIGNKSLIKHMRTLRYNDVLNIVDPATRLRIENDAICKKLQLIDVKGSDFCSLTTSRNEDCHPKNINISAILAKISTLKSTQELSEENEEFVELSENIYNEVENLLGKDFLPLIRELNKRKK